MERGRGHVEADIAGDACLGGLIQAGEIGALVKLLALGDGAEEEGGWGHGVCAARPSMRRGATPCGAAPYRGARFANIRCRVRLCMFRRRAVSDTL